MKIALLLMLALILTLGCARVMVETPREPIKLDISMRLDVYQHIAKDIDAIEDIVSSPKQTSQPGDQESLLNILISNAYAEEGLSPEVEQAAYRRRDRHDELISWETKGVIGENHLGLIEIIDTAAADQSAQQLVAAENADRMVIYRAVAKKNNVSVEEIQEMYAKRLQEDAPPGTKIEILDQAVGIFKWQTK